MNPARNIQENAAIAIQGDAILAVGPETELAKLYQPKQTIHAEGKLVLPGFINGHTHVPMTLMRGLHDDVTLHDWLYKYIFPAEAKNVTEDFVRWGTRLAAAEQIRGGVTTYADMYYFENAVAEETKTAGMRGVLGETWIDFPAPDSPVSQTIAGCCPFNTARCALSTLKSWRWMLVARLVAARTMPAAAVSFVS